MDIISEIKEISSETKFRKEILDFLLRICKIDTTPNPNISIMKEREEKVFRIIKEKLKNFSFPKSRIVKNFMSPEIEKHPAYTIPYYAGKSSLGKVYNGRYNLLYFIDNKKSEGNNTALNAHIDVVSPFFLQEWKEIISMEGELLMIKEMYL